MSATWRLLLKRFLVMKQSKDIYDLVGITASACAATNKHYVVAPLSGFLRAF
jgi:hypothetical protein